MNKTINGTIPIGSWMFPTKKSITRHWRRYSIESPLVLEFFTTDALLKKCVRKSGKIVHTLGGNDKAEIEISDSKLKIIGINGDVTSHPVNWICSYNNSNLDCIDPMHLGSCRNFDASHQYLESRGENELAMFVTAILLQRFKNYPTTKFPKGLRFREATAAEIESLGMPKEK